MDNFFKTITEILMFILMLIVIIIAIKFPPIGVFAYFIACYFELI